MKVILYLLTVLLGFVLSLSQKYTNLEKLWIYEYYRSTERCYIETWGDYTVINGGNVRTLTREFYSVFSDPFSGDLISVNGPYSGGFLNIKLLENQVYVYNLDRDEFEFVCDFDAEVGDTWDLKTYYDYDCNEIDPFHIEFTNTVDEINTIEGELNPIEVLTTITLISINLNISWYN